MITLPAGFVFHPPDKLNLPPDEPVELPDDQLTAGTERVDITPYTVEEASGWKLRSAGIASAIATALIIWFVILTAMWIIAPDHMWSVSFAVFLFSLFSIMGFCVIQTDAQQIRVFTDNRRSKVIVLFGSGYAIRHWWLSPFKAIPLIDLQTSKDMTVAITVLTRESIPVIVDTRTNGKPAEEYIKNYLMFAPGVIDQIISGILTDRIQKLFGLNGWRTLVADRALVFTWIGKIFGSAKVITPAERELGWLVISQRAESFKWAPGRGEQLALAMFEMELLPQIMDTLKGRGSDSEILQAARRILDKQIEESRTVINASPNITTVAAGGNTDLAVRSGVRGGA